MRRLKMIKEWFCGIKERFFGEKEEETVAEFVPNYYKQMFNVTPTEVMALYKTLPSQGFESYSYDGTVDLYPFPITSSFLIAEDKTTEISKKEFKEIKKTFIKNGSK